MVNGQEHAPWPRAGRTTLFYFALLAGLGLLFAAWSSFIWARVVLTQSDFAVRTLEDRTFQETLRLVGLIHAFDALFFTLAGACLVAAGAGIRRQRRWGQKVLARVLWYGAAWTGAFGALAVSIDWIVPADDGEMLAAVGLDLLLLSLVLALMGILAGSARLARALGLPGKET